MLGLFSALYGSGLIGEASFALPKTNGVSHSTTPCSQKAAMNSGLFSITSFNLGAQKLLLFCL
jgi:hypothetical protein